MEVSNSLQTKKSSVTAPATKDVADATIARPCPACGRTTDHLRRFSIRDSDILQCRSCGLGRTETSAFDPVGYYTEDYFAGGHADGYSDYRGAEPVLRREFARSVEFIGRFSGSGKLLELGCAYGFFLMEAARHFEVAGIELAADAVGHCRRAGLNVLHGMADEANLQRIGCVDVIVLFDVIEHLPDPRETLALCHRYLNPGGIIVLTTGDFGSTLARLAGAKWRLDDAAAAPLVLYAGEHSQAVRGTGSCNGARGPSLENRPCLLDRLSIAANAGVAPRCRGERQPDRLTGQPVRCHASGAAKTIMMGNDRLSLPQIAVLVAYAAGMAGGQVLFKAAALRYVPEGSLWERLSSLLANSYFVAAILLYVGLTVLWVWVLTFTPLSRAYPFVALAFAVTPLLAGLIFAEPIALRLILGTALILCGLVLVAS